MENSATNAFGYEVVGFVESEGEALRIVEEGGPLPDGFCWAAPTQMMKLRRFRAVKCVRYEEGRGS